MKRTITALLIAIAVLLFAGMALAGCSTAHASEHQSDTTFKTSPRDITNARVLKQQTADKMAREMLGMYLRAKDAYLEAVEEYEAEVAAAETAAYAASYQESYGDGSGGYKYSGYYPDENTGAFAYDENLEVFLGEDGIYRDSDGYVVVAANKGQLGAFDLVDTEYGQGKVYDTGCGYGIIDVYKERWVDEGR